MGEVVPFAIIVEADKLSAPLPHTVRRVFLWRGDTIKAPSPPDDLPWVGDFDEGRR